MPTEFSWSDAHETVPRVHVVIPVHNRAEYTRACLQSLSRQTYPDVSVLVVDDGSTDGTATMVAAEFPYVTVLEGGGDLWWAGAIALGVGHALERGSDDDFVLTLNNDTTVDPDYVETLLRVFTAGGEQLLVGSVAVDSDDRDTIFDGGPAINWSTGEQGLNHRGDSLQRLRAAGLDVMPASALSGRGTLFPVECFRRIGNFNAPRFPQYAADYEFSVRAASQAGYELVVSYNAPVYAEIRATGIDLRLGRLPWGRFVTMFFTRRSSACLLYRWRFAWAAAPRGYKLRFLVLDSARLLGGSLRDQLQLGRGMSGRKQVDEAEVSR